MSKKIYIVTRTTGYSYDQETEVVAAYELEADAAAFVEARRGEIGKRDAYLDEASRLYHEWLKQNPHPLLDCQKPVEEHSGTRVSGWAKRLDLTPQGYHPITEQDSKNNEEHYARWVEVRNAQMSQSMPDMHELFLKEGEGFDNPDGYEVVEVEFHARPLEQALLAIAAEDWNDETQPLLDGKSQGIGPCARARRTLGIESYPEAFERRMKSLPVEYRSKRFKESM